MPIYTLRIHETKDAHYLRQLHALMKRFGHKSATKTFERAIQEHQSLMDRIQALEAENQQLHRSVTQLKTGIRRYLEAQSNLAALGQ